MPVIRTADARQPQTPSGTMTTLASPALGGAERPVWRVDVGPGAPAGPGAVLNVGQSWAFPPGSADGGGAGGTFAGQAGRNLLLAGHPAAGGGRATARPAPPPGSLSGSRRTSSGCSACGRTSSASTCAGEWS